MTSGGSASIAANSASTSSILPSGKSQTNVLATQTSSSATPISSSSDSNNSSLSTGAKIGIGVGAALGVVIIALLVYLLALLNRIQKKQRNKEAFAAFPPPETTQGGYMENAQTYGMPSSSNYPVTQEHMGGGYPMKQEYMGDGYPAKQEYRGDGAVEMGERDPPVQLE
jgi:hypothetical protein